MIRAESFVRAVEKRGFELWTGVPCSYLKPFINYVIDAGRAGDKTPGQEPFRPVTVSGRQSSSLETSTGRGLQYIPAVNEGDAVAIATGSTLAGRLAVVMFQNSGLGNAVNPLSSLNYIFKIPVLIITSLRGEPGGPHDEPQHELMGAITTGMLEILKIRWEYFPTEEAEVEAAVDRAVRHMGETGLPFALVMRKDSVEPYALKSRVVERGEAARKGGLGVSEEERPLIGAKAGSEGKKSAFRGDLEEATLAGAKAASEGREPLEVGKVSAAAALAGSGSGVPHEAERAGEAVRASEAGRVGNLAATSQRKEPKVRREAILRVIQKSTPPGTGDLVIATTGYTGRELYALQDRPNQFYMVGSMGCASSFALGVALTRPDRRVVVVDGDGAVLMRMGALAVLGTQKPANLIHIVLDNGSYESTGNQATVSPSVDLCAVARACGYDRVVELNDPEELAQILAERDRPGYSSALTFIRVPILSGAPEGLPRPKVTPPEVAQRFAHFVQAMKE